ncbi:hypothetical protein CHS0354_003683 [Potamilus streckersoni]|uniref:Lysozyme n=1 Tax=Potamilus streckersoni TaxID=2493646 RepID=A0AAE0SS89_9BIVA|nr:hypothetical protein CHS0354_003683 [Potamilus streckersoni]
MHQTNSSPLFWLLVISIGYSQPLIVSVNDITTTPATIPVSETVHTSPPPISATSDATTTLEASTTTGTASTTQYTTATTEEPKEDCVIDDADFLDQLRQELINDEGYKEEIYEDTTGNPTFGIGHKITRKDPEFGKPLGTRVSKERIEEAFKADVKAAIESCCKLFNNFQNLPKEVKLIILNIRFNLGHTGLAKFAKFRDAVNIGDWEKAADEMEHSIWFNQVPNRAKRLVERMRKVGK